jgi:hypothetical protein
VVVGSNLELHSTWGQGASFSNSPAPPTPSRGNSMWKCLCPQWRGEDREAQGLAFSFQGPCIPW